MSDTDLRDHFDRQDAEFRLRAASYDRWIQTEVLPRVMAWATKYDLRPWLATPNGYRKSRRKPATSGSPLGGGGPGSDRRHEGPRAAG